MDETAVCRWCRRELIGEPYRFGLPAYDPTTMEPVPVNFYGGFVCSERCDYNVCIEMNSSMPGAGECKQISSCSPEGNQLARNWNN